MKSCDKNDGSIFRVIIAALKISGLFWKKGNCVQKLFNILLKTAFVASNLYLLQAAFAYKTLAFVLYGTRVFTSTVTLLLFVLQERKFERLLSDLNDEAKRQLPHTRQRRILRLSSILTGLSSLVLLSFLVAPTYIIFFTDHRNNSHLASRFLMYRDELLFVLTIWYPLCFFPALFIVISQTFFELLAEFNDVVPALFCKAELHAITKSLSDRFRAGRLRRHRIRKLFVEVRRLFAPCLFFWYGLTFLGFCAELSSFLRPSDSWAERYYKALSSAHSWAQFWGVSCAANSVYVRGRDTWSILQDASLRLPLEVSGTRELDMLKEDVKEMVIAFSIGGFYKLTLRTALSVFSCMLTYAFVWYQIGPGSKSTESGNKGT